MTEYRWSSYPSYVTKVSAPEWLYQQEIYDQLGAKSSKRKRYQAFVEMGIDEDIAAFYGKGNQAPYLGSDEFRAWAYQQRETSEEAVSRKNLRFFRPNIGTVAKTIALYFDVEVGDILRSQRGRVNSNVARWVVMYLGQEVCALTLREIADYLGLKRTGSIPTTIAKLKLCMAGDRNLRNKVNEIKREYDT